MSKELHHLFKAIKEHRIEQIKVVLKDHQALVNTKDDKGYTALAIAAECGTTGILDELLKHGAHINHQAPPKLYTPLMLAVRSNRFDLVKYLLRHDANATLTDTEGNTALWHAQHHGYQDIIALLQKSSETQSS